MACVGKLRDEVLAPDLCWIHLKGGGEQVDHPLAQVSRLWATGAAVGVGGHAIGEDSYGPSRDVPPVVSAGGKQARACLKRAERAHVGADVQVLRDLERNQRPVLLRPSLDVEVLAAAVCRGLDGFCPSLDPLHWAAAELCRCRHEVVLGVGADLAAEATANIRRNDT